MVETQEGKFKKNVLSRLSELRSSIQAANKMAKQTEIKSRTKTKAWYDRTATVNRELVPGSKVLILEPTDARKMHAKWSTPRTVVKKTNGAQLRDSDATDKTIASVLVQEDYQGIQRNVSLIYPENCYQMSEITVCWRKRLWEF